MPTIFLKPNSPEFADKPVHEQGYAPCHMPDCTIQGTHKAPKRGVRDEYYFFCIEHVSEYNKSWDFFDGLSDGEVQEELYRSRHGDRPTWKSGVNGTAEDMLYRKMWKTYHGDEAEPPPRPEKKRYIPGEIRNTPAFEAMALMGLEPPVDLKKIKKRYKELAKKHHPDLNRGCKKSEELLKEINMAYTLLRLAYENFEELPDRT